MYKDMGTWTAGAWGRGEVRGYSRILEEASRLLIELAASHPEHAAVIRAFTPLALARGKLLDAYALSRKTKPLDGFPMFRFEELPVCSEKSGAIASAVLEAVAEGFAGAREQVGAQARKRPPPV